MTMKLTVKRFRTRRPDPVAAPAQPPRLVPTPVIEAPAGAKPAGASGQPVIGNDAFFPVPGDDGFGTQTFRTARPDTPLSSQSDAPHDIDLIRREGLTGRQLRMARRLAQKHGLPALSLIHI